MAAAIASQRCRTGDSPLGESVGPAPGARGSAAAEVVLRQVSRIQLEDWDRICQRHLFLPIESGGQSRNSLIGDEVFVAGVEGEVTLGDLCEVKHQEA